MSFKTELSKVQADIDKVLSEYIPNSRWDGDPNDVARYATLAKGKRLRPFITTQVAGLFGVDYDVALRAGACIEMIHNFSLIHDDLPCIDNDTIRNGRPSAWAKFGEWRAIWGGDMLNNLPYTILATDEKIGDTVTRLKLIQILSEMINGMIMGEYMDIVAETGKFQTEPEITEIQLLKTGCLFRACVLFGATLGHADTKSRDALVKFADAMGLCFQITDDILDATGDCAKVGKTLGKDTNKATFVSLLGLSGARTRAQELAKSAQNALSIFDSRADNLRELLDFIIVRES
jgi:farnesyl diphosphate synthase